MQSDENGTTVTRCTDTEYNDLIKDCCRGILLDNEEYIMKNEAIEITTRPSLGLATKETRRLTKEFRSQIEMNSFEEGIKSFGSGCDISLSLKNLNIGTSSEINDSSKKVKDNVSKKDFNAIAEYMVVAVKSMQLFEQNFKLTPLALSEIRKIEELIRSMDGQNKSIRDLCCKFIDTFGSHVCSGNIEIGGILKTSTVYDNETLMTFEQYQGLAKRAHAAYIKYLKTANAEANFDFKDETNKETSIKAEESTFVFSCSQLSYPSVDWNYAKWLNNLITNPKSWCVIGRGLPTGIWNILLNHSNDLSDCYRIAAMIRNAWQTKWDQNSDEKLDKVVQCNISSISDFIGRTTNFSLENITKVIVKLTCCAGLNNRFKEYWSVTKFVSFFKIAVTKSNELPLKHKLCLKILLGLLCQSALNEHGYVLKWFKSPLFRCTENVFEAVRHFINNALKPIYTDIINDNAEKHWKSQVNEQITTEIALIVKHHGEHFHDKTQCIYLARCVSKLGFDFEKMTRSYLHGDNPVKDFFIAFSQENIKMSLPKDLQFQTMIESDYFLAWHISKSIYPKCNELQLYEVFVQELSDFCKKTLETAVDQKDLGTVLLIASLGFNIYYRKFDADPLSSMIIKRFKIHALLWNTPNEHTSFEGLTCYHAISALNSVFIDTVETLEKEDPEFIKNAISFIASLRSNIYTHLQNTRIKKSVQRECIVLEVIVSKAFKNIEADKIVQLKSSDDIRILVTYMAFDLHKSSEQVCLYSREIPSVQKEFVAFLRECFLSLWQNSRTQLMNRCQPDASHAIAVVDDFFKTELKRLCNSSLILCSGITPVDIRSYTVQHLCNRPIVTFKDAERFINIHFNGIKRFLMRFFRIFAILYKKAEDAINSASTAYLESKRLRQ